MKRWLVMLSLSLLFAMAQAAIEEHKFSDTEQEQRYKHLINELRCLVCQNQNLADSNAALANDLRSQVYKMIQAGDSDEKILEFMVNRYGDFVLYRPPLKSSTFFLWIGPFILLFVGIIVVIVFARRRQAVTATTLDEQQQARVRQLLDDKEDHS